METQSIETENIIAKQDEAVIDEDQFQTDQVLTVAGGHFVHDSFSAFLSPILPDLQARLSTNYAMTGSLAIFTQLPSLLNPLIGHLADRVSLRYFIILAPAVTGTLMGLLGRTSSYLSLVFVLLLAGISIAAFHAPAPAMISRVSGRRVGKGMSYFMASGELGRTFGPVLLALGIDRFGLGGIWRLSLIGWIVSIVLYFRLRHISARPQKQTGSWRSIIPKARIVFPVLTWIMFTRIFMMVALTTFLPIFVTDVRGGGIWLRAWSLFLLEGAGVIGALFTGTWSDRLGRAPVLGLMVSTAPFFLFAFLYLPQWLTIPLLILLGLTAISPTPVLLAIVQDEFPDNRALANGTFIALNFLIRAFGIWSLGLIADRYGLVNAYLWSGLLALLSIPAIFRLPRSRVTRS